MNMKLMIASLLLAGCLNLSAQQITVQQDVIDCGQIMFRKPFAVEYDLQNTDTKPLAIREVRTSCGCTAVDYPHSPIPAGEHFKVRAVYDAKQMGHFLKQIGLYAGASNQPVMLSLRGVVVAEAVDFSGNYPFAIGSILADKDAVEFDDVNSGDRLFQKIHVMNNSSETVQPVVMHLPGYLQAQVSPSKIAPGHAGEITLLLDSRLLHNNGLTQTSVYLGMFPGDVVSPNKEIPVSVVRLPNFRSFNEQNMELAPHLQLSADTLDLGAFGSKSKKKGEILVRNTGRTTLDISNLQMFTPGLEVSLGSRKIAPGEETRLKVTAVAKELRRRRARPRVLMITNDPARPKVVIVIQIK
ncbi:DUF1573 domain-containing protein [Prevotella sp. kh1p2]|uniref:DUF1573 domain-containing protein n=1 Tax=Prevotella sp. kh1p2 TaxID=1761883 RepID=UPI0008C18838|nr:DUF1573 domain-containing protein [Prevotella sp. kh1p2]SES74516.1 Protein of unknown function [Prevotella sp. kh1p2]SNU10560.1 Protein of unknown function [Prevotellaceae bacterium KH2P17]